MLADVQSCQTVTQKNQLHVDRTSPLTSPLKKQNIVETKRPCVGTKSVRKSSELKLLQRALDATFRTPL